MLKLLLFPGQKPESPDFKQKCVKLFFGLELKLHRKIKMADIVMISRLQMSGIAMQMQKNVVF